MPGKLKVRILAARDLPVMDRASDLADAFVEVRFLREFKSEFLVTGNMLKGKINSNKMACKYEKQHNIAILSLVIMCVNQILFAIFITVSLFDY